MSFQIRCFIMKLAFYHLASYADELWIAAEEIVVDIMDVQIDDWVAVTMKTIGFQAFFSIYSPSVPLIASSQSLSSSI